MAGAKPRPAWRSFVRVLILLVLSALLLAAPAEAAGKRQAVAQVSPAGMTQILAPPQMPALGSARAKISVVEYMDYNCPYCRLMAPNFQRLVKTDPDVRVIFKDWPIFGPVSTYAARAALAAQYQGKYLVAHQALLSTPDRLSSIQQVRGALRHAGININRLKADLTAHGTAINATLARIRAEARELGLEGTPGLIVGDLFVPGAVDFADLQKLIAIVRNQEHHQPP
jgi:protein-disulfide isomerase